ncbi:hypothetical protein [Pararhizobium sp.]|uniref:hypothetical protein n=1 Tax=Pararhizobium sp. TaxID=1977563 RepID=UPI003D09FA36
MIVYNVGRQFFPLKDDAETERKAQFLPPRATHKIRIEDREQLAAFLNGLCENATMIANPEDPEANPRIALDDAALDFVPQFVKDDWARRRGMMGQRNG